MNWTQYDVKFLYDNGNASVNPWSGHRRFAYDLVRFMKPKTMVELGTLSGTSFFSFCQAVKDGGLDTKCFAVDTWKGDLHSGEYGEEVFEFVCDKVKQDFNKIATLIRSTFDEALVNFEDETIDLLHIDGYHTYDAVFHDYTTWLPKLAPNGVILLHDTEMRVPGFGVHQLWDDLKLEFPHMEFDHSFGLGVLFPKGHTAAFADIIAQRDTFKILYKV